MSVPAVTRSANVSCPVRALPVHRTVRAGGQVELGLHDLQLLDVRERLRHGPVGGEQRPRVLQQGRSSPASSRCSGSARAAPGLQRPLADTDARTRWPPRIPRIATTTVRRARFSASLAGQHQRPRLRRAPGVESACLRRIEAQRELARIATDLRGELLQARAVSVARQFQARDLRVELPRVRIVALAGIEIARRAARRPSAASRRTCRPATRPAARASIAAMSSAAMNGRRSARTVERSICVVPASSATRTCSAGARSRRAPRVSCRSVKSSSNSCPSRASVPFTLT